MFGWNPFKKQSAPASEVPDAPDLLSEIVRVQGDTLGCDLRPMQRLIRDTTFLLPLHEPPVQQEEGTVLRYLTFEEDEVMCAFSGDVQMRDFFRDVPGGAPPALSYQTGKSLCQMAQHAVLRKIILNPNADVLFALPPLVFGAIAHGFVLGHIVDEGLPVGEVALGKNVAGMPPMDALDAFRVTLGQFGASEAWWAGLYLPPDEMRFCLGVAAPPNAFEALPQQLVENWIGRWPLPTPLHVFALSGENPARDAAFRASDRIL